MVNSENNIVTIQVVPIVERKPECVSGCRPRHYPRN